MKNLLAIAMTASLLFSTQASARDHGGYRGERTHEYRDHHHRRGGDGRWVAPLIGGIILGAVITSARQDDERYQRSERVYEYPRDTYYRPRDQYCVEEQHYDYYGNIYYTKRCYYR